MDLLNQIVESKERIAVLRNSLVEARGHLAEQRLDVEALKEELGQLKLSNRALTRLLIDKGVVTGDELDSCLHKVDAEDGFIDGKIPIDPKNRRLHGSGKSEIPEGTFKPSSMFH